VDNLLCKVLQLFTKSMCTARTTHHQPSISVDLLNKERYGPARQRSPSIDDLVDLYHSLALQIHADQQPLIDVDQRGRRSPSQTPHCSTSLSIFVDFSPLTLTLMHLQLSQLGMLQHTCFQ